jgi:hypothetical protein
MSVNETPTHGKPAPGAARLRAIAALLALFEFALFHFGEWSEKVADLAARL